MSEPAEMEDALRSVLERLVSFHGDRPWAYGDVVTAARVLALAVEDVHHQQIASAARRGSVKWVEGQALA